jgi:hypothetical protein
MMMTTQRHFS